MAVTTATRRDGGRTSSSFTHGVNRHGEPHLHDHVLVGARPDGARRRVLDSRAPLRAPARGRRALSLVAATRTGRTDAVVGVAILRGRRARRRARRGVSGAVGRTSSTIAVRRLHWDARQTRSRVGGATFAASSPTASVDARRDRARDTRRALASPARSKVVPTWRDATSSRRGQRRDASDRPRRALAHVRSTRSIRHSLGSRGVREPVDQCARGADDRRIVRERGAATPRRATSSTSGVSARATSSARTIGRSR